MNCIKSNILQFSCYQTYEIHTSPLRETIKNTKKVNLAKTCLQHILDPLGAQIEQKL